MIKLLGFLFGCVYGSAYAQCAGSFTYIDNGSSNSYSLNTSSERLLINSGTYTGNINNFTSGSEICVNTGAVFSPSNINNPAGTINNYGTSNLPNLALSSGFKFNNLAGTSNFNSNPNFNAVTTFFNEANAVINFLTTLQFGGGSSLNNNGTINFSFDFQPAAGTTVVNNFRLNFNGGNFNPSGVFTNNGQVVGSSFININSGSTVINNCSFLPKQGFNNNSNSTQNYGYIIISGVNGFPNDLWQNNAAFFQGPNGVVVGKRYINSNAISGGGRYYFEKTAGYAENVHTINQGGFTGTLASPIIFYDTTQSSAPNIFDVQNVNPVNTVRSVFTPPTENDALSSCSPIFFPTTAAITISKSDGKSVTSVGQTNIYLISVQNAGPADASNSILTDPAVSSLSCTSVTCAVESGPGTCPTASNVTISALQNAGIVLNSFSNGTKLNFTLTCLVL